MQPEPVVRSYVVRSGWVPVFFRSIQLDLKTLSSPASSSSFAASKRSSLFPRRKILDTGMDESDKLARDVVLARFAMSELILSPALTPAAR